MKLPTMKKKFVYHVKSKVSILYILHILGWPSLMKNFFINCFDRLPCHFIHYYEKIVKVKFSSDYLPHLSVLRGLKNDQIG